MRNDPSCSRCGARLEASGSCLACVMELALDDDGAEAAAPPDAHGPTSRFESGSTVGPYRIGRVLGEGGMGIVYLAEQSEPVSRRVALKVIKLGLDTNAVLARFEAEQQALAVMEHDAIARLYEAGRTDHGRPYFAMEYVEGEPLHRYCDAQRLDLRARLELFIRVCSAVQHAHRKGVVHRDLKPTNVLVAADGQPKIIDFGIAKAIERPLTEKSLYTEAGVLLGTPEYMSPEQAAGNPLAVDTRTDVYALGAMLYELLTGVLPLDSDELRKLGFDEICRRIREEMPSKPSTRVDSFPDTHGEVASRRRRPSLASLRRDLLGDLDRIVMKALEKEQDRRYDSPAELAADVARFLRNEPVLAQRPSAAYQLEKWVSRNRAVAALLAAMLIGLVGFSVAMGLLYRNSQRNLARAVEAEAEAKQVSEFVVGVFEVANPAVTSGETVTARELLDNAAENIVTELAEQPRVQSAMMDTIGSAYMGLGLYDPALEFAKKSYERMRDAMGENDPDTARQRLAYAFALMGAGQFDESESHVDAAFETLESHPEARELDIAEGLGMRIRLYWRKGRSEDVVRLAEQVLEIRERELGSDHPSTDETRNLLGRVYLSTGRLKQALDVQSEVLAYREERYGAEHNATASALNEVAECHRQLGDYDKAEPLFKRSLEIEEQIYGPGEVSLAFGYNNLGIMYRQMKRYEDAETHLLEAIRIRENGLPEDHPLLAWTYDNLGVLYTDWGRYEDAESRVLRALEIAEKAVGEKSTSFAIVVNNLARVHANQGRIQEAEAGYRRSIAIDIELGGERASNLGGTYFNLGDLLEKEGRTAEAIEYYENSLDIDLDSLPEDHAAVVKTRDRLEALKGG